MKKLIIFIFLSTIILTGCSNDDAYNNAIQKGLDHIASEEYQKAEGAFELALDEKKDDEKATALLQQTIYYQDALKAIDEGELDRAKEKAEEVISIENGSPALVKKSEEIITSVEDKKAEDKKAEDKKAEDKKAEEEKSEQENAMKEKKEKESEKQDKENNAQAEEDYINTVSPHNKDKEILSLRGYAVYIEDGMEIDAETDEAIFSNHPMYKKENVDAALSWIEEIYEEGMSKGDLKEELLHTVEAPEDAIDEAIKIFFETNS